MREDIICSYMLMFLFLYIDPAKAGIYKNNPQIKHVKEGAGFKFRITGVLKSMEHK